MLARWVTSAESIGNKKKTVLNVLDESKPKKDACLNCDTGNFSTSENDIFESDV